MDKKEQKIVITNSIWATFTLAIFDSLIWLWYLGHMSEILIGILFGLSIWITIIDYRARRDASIKEKKSIALLIIQLLLLLGDILICYYCHNNIWEFIISTIVTFVIVGFVFYGKKFIKGFFGKCLDIILCPDAIIIIVTLALGISSILISNVTWKVAGVFVSTFLSSYKKSIKGWYKKNVYDKYIVSITK